MKVAQFYFDVRLAELLSERWRQLLPSYTFRGPQSVKHLVEAAGIPHTELGRILVNGAQAEPRHLVQDGDRVEVFSAASLSTSRTQPRFVIDGHLGRLCAGLRMLGLDCLYDAHLNDADLAGISDSQDRILLTRDRRLLMRKIVSSGYLVRSLEREGQLKEVVERFGLGQWAHPFRRCIRCNGMLQPVSKEDIFRRLQPLTRRYFSDFRICPSCAQIYWKGSHLPRMERLIRQLMPLHRDRQPA